MLCKGRIFAAVAAFGAFASFTGATAQPASIGLALQQDNTAITKVDYYYPGRYGYEDDSYYEDRPFPIPIIGGVAALVGGVLSGAFDDSPYNSPPCYVSPYYGSPYYRESYRYTSYDYNPYDRDRYYFDSHSEGRGDYSDRWRHSEYERFVGYDYTYYYHDAYYRY